VKIGSAIPFGWRALVAKAAVTMRPDPGRALAQASMRAALYAMNQAAWFADDHFWPAWRDARFRGPLFVIGHQRSGTTLLHRLLAGGTDARALTLADMLFPSIAAQRLAETAFSLDTSMGGRLRTGLDRAQERRFGPLDALHRMRLDQVEEDEILLWAIGASGMCATDDPRSVAATSLASLRHAELWPAETRERVFDYYRDCLRKKAYREIRKVDLAPWIVSKNPAFCQRIPVLLATFPEARFVHLVRDPREAIPSRLHLVRAIWRHRLPWFRDPTEAQIAAIVDDSVASYLLAHRDLSPVPRERKIVVRFEELMDDPNRTADSVRWQFGLERRAADRDPARGARKRNPRHVLAEFGLDDATIEGRLRDVFEEHGVHWKNSREEP